MELKIMLLWHGHELEAIVIRGDKVNDVPTITKVTLSTMCY